MREWLSELPVLGRFFSVDMPEEEHAEVPGNPQLNAERELGRRLKVELEQARAAESTLKEEVVRLSREGADNKKNLEAIESLLADPDRAQNAIVYYQLRQIWFACHKELKNLVRDLYQNMEKEERQQQLARFKSKQEQQARKLESSLSAVNEEKRVVMEKVGGLEKQVRASQKIWHYFKRRRLNDELQAAKTELEPVEQQLEDVRRHIREVEDRVAPKYTGLSVEGRRRVNLAAIALAQYLYLSFRKDNVADMARSARNKAVYEVHFGPPQECLSIMRQIREVEGRWRSDKGRPEKVRRRARFLSSKVKFNEEMQTVPDPRSVDYLQPSISSEGEDVTSDSSPLPVNVLELDLWDLRDSMV